MPYGILRSMSADEDELRQLRAEAYRQYKRGMRRAWLGVGLSAVAAGVAAGASRAVARHYQWHVPLWAGILSLCGVAAYTAWAWRHGGKRLPCTRGHGRASWGTMTRQARHRKKTGHHKSRPHPAHVQRIDPDHPHGTRLPVLCPVCRPAAKKWDRALASKAAA